MPTAQSDYQLRLRWCGPLHALASLTEANDDRLTEIRSRCGKLGAGWAS